MADSAVLFTVLSIAAVALWAVGITVPLSENGRFRAFALAVLASFLVAGQTLGWSRAVVLGMVMGWGIAIVRGLIQPPVLVEEPASHGGAHH